ncbi:hypothetical protein NFIA_064050 [Paecilomyces variotii No. 5]|uniref:Uncharacterized protein n=1 Tax=Byssochlamys spectabilis (strain No. 5 / NBRC 109023) TaxID=1356009 RepID=V5FGC5_BYSSN|nr:hypothetical protein NFIA_064050 [Paecilomyces variotii No. 5]
MRTRSQPVSPGGFVSLETARAPRRKRTTTAAESTAAKTEKSAPKQQTKKTTAKRTRKTTTTSRKKPSKKAEPASSEEPQSTNEEETQSESQVSVVVQQPTTETTANTDNTESEHPFLSFHPSTTHGTQETAESGLQRPIVEAGLPIQETPFTPVRYTPPEGNHNTSIPEPASASSIDTPSAGAALFAAARAAIYAVSPFTPRLADTQATRTTHDSAAIASPIPGQFPDVSFAPVIEQCTPTAIRTDRHDSPVSSSPSLPAHVATEVPQETSPPVDTEMSDAPSLERRPRFWYPTVLSPILEERESSPATSRGQRFVLQSATSEAQGHHSSVSSPAFDSPFTPARGARPVSRLGHRADVFPSSSLAAESPFTPAKGAALARPVSRLDHREDVFLSSSPTAESPFTPAKGAALARPVSRLGHRADIFPSSSPAVDSFTPARAAALTRPESRLGHRADILPSSSPQTPCRTPTASRASGYSVSPSAFSLSSSSPLSSPPENLSPVLPNTPGVHQTSATQTTPSLLSHHQTQFTGHGRLSQCHSCGATLQCPNGHPPGNLQSRSLRPSRNRALTKRVAPIRKRTRDNVSDDEASDIITPSNKRRNMGPPGSTPFARRSTPLSSRLVNRTTPFSERRRRRLLEQQGRIDKTLFRLPQLIAQAESDRQVSNEPEITPCEPSPLAGHIDANKENRESEHDNGQPSTPETPRRGWGIRGLFSSVPRSFSRILPTLGLSPERPESSGITAPASERISRTTALSPISPLSFGVKSNNAPTSQKPKESSPHDLSYSLFPAPIDRSRYLQVRSDSRGDAKRRKLGDGKKSVVEQSAPATTPERSQRGSEADADADDMDGGKKRKRSSTSPDVIPNPPGSSYGLDLDYFTYGPESDEEAEEAQRTTPVPDKRPVRSILRPQRPPPKRVRFDTSPENTPSKLRLRATDSYTGQQFMGVPDLFAPRDNASRQDAVPQPETATTSAAVSATQTTVEQPAQRSPGFIPNQSGTFRLDYDAFSSDSESNGEPSPARPASQGQPPASREETESRPPAWTQPPPPRPTPAHAALPSTSEPTVDNQALAKARSQAEKYKPKTPSGLRTASRYASPMGASPLGEVPGGDDDFARDAQWLLANCPSGDLTELSWPKQGALTEGLGVDPEAGRLLAQLWEEEEVEEGYRAFSRSLEEFAETLA